MKKENNDIRKIDEKEEEKVSGGYLTEHSRSLSTMEDKWCSALGIKRKTHIFKPDEYFLDGQKITKNEVEKLYGRWLSAGCKARNKIIEDYKKEQ